MKQISQSDDRYHIPSLSSLALLFTSDDYVPSSKIRNALNAYITNPVPIRSTPISPKFFRWSSQLYTYKHAVSSLAAFLFVCVTVFGLTLSRKPVRFPQLLMEYPHQGQVVTRQVKTGGKAPGAEFVWVIVHLPDTDSSYYLQGPFPVKESGTWSGQIIIGPGQLTADIQAEVRAFVNPKETISENMTTGKYKFDSWPDYAVSATDPVLVTRKAKSTEK